MTLFHRSWGQGPPILFVAAWALNSDAWAYEMASLCNAGFRCIAFDRRGHGRSDDPGGGYNMDTLADDLAAVVEQLGLREFVLVGHSLGAAECVRYLTRHGASRVRRLVLIAPTTPMLKKTADNPDGLDAHVFDAMRSAFRDDFPGIVGANIRPFVDANTSERTIDWIIAMMSSTSLQAVIECNRAFTEADFRGELPRIATRTLIIQGDADALGANRPDRPPNRPADAELPVDPLRGRAARPDLHPQAPAERRPDRLRAELGHAGNRGYFAAALAPAGWVCARFGSFQPGRTKWQV